MADFHRQLIQVIVVMWLCCWFTTSSRHFYSRATAFTFPAITTISSGKTRLGRRHTCSNNASSFITTATASTASSMNNHHHHRYKGIIRQPSFTVPHLQMYTSSSSSSQQKQQVEEKEEELKMENIYTEWTIQDDELLYKEYSQNHASIPKLASLLGRGLRGVEARLNKLQDVNSFAYQRLFTSNNQSRSDDDNYYDDGGGGGGGNNEQKKKSSLVPAKEVMRRIQWDMSLNPSDFTVYYFDRVEDKLLSCPFDSSNDSIRGKEELFVFAIPEHRIMAFHYKERVVWDKEKRLDRVFGSMTAGNGDTIDIITETYDEWHQQQMEIKAYNQQRQKDIVQQLKSTMGDVLFTSLKNISNDVQRKSKELIGGVDEDEIESYVNTAMDLFRSSSSTNAHDNSDGDGIARNVDKNTILEDLDMFSNLVALLPDEDLRERILLHIDDKVKKLNGGQRSSNNKNNDNSKQQQPLMELREEDLNEKFVRGSGAGGQKINKTANKVILLHEPTQLRVECQETRSLQQNRKIARKRMRLKLDEYHNGSQSKVQMKLEKTRKIKARNKARNKARQKKKKDKKQE